MDINTIVRLSRKYGKDPEYVLAGGGNTSCKNPQYIFVKASGVPLADIDAEGFVKVDREKLSRIWKKQYPDEPDIREKEVLKDLLSSKAPGEENKRPSVETLMHSLLPQTYVVHTHPSLINGITCSKNGKEKTIDFFGDMAAWVPTTNPGYILASEIKNIMEIWLERKGKAPDILFLQNHGLVVGGESEEEIDEMHEKLMRTISSNLQKVPNLEPISPDTVEIRKYQKALSEVLKETTGKDFSVVSFFNNEIEKLIQSEENFFPVSGAFSPDHIVYYGHKTLFVSGVPDMYSEKEAKKVFTEYLRTYWRTNPDVPGIFAVQNLCVFAVGESERTALNAKKLFLDTVKVSVYTESFGGPQFMPEEQIRFIVHWEAEKYRKKMSKKEKE